MSKMRLWNAKKGLLINPEQIVYIKRRINSRDQRYLEITMSNGTIFNTDPETYDKEHLYRNFNIIPETDGKRGAS